MGVSIKTAEEIEKMRVSGRLAADVLRMIEPHVQPGVTTQQLNDICHDYMVNEQDVVPAPLNYRGFPRSIWPSSPTASKWTRAASPGTAGRLNGVTAKGGKVTLPRDMARSPSPSSRRTRET